MKLCRQEHEASGGILESEAWQLGLYGPGGDKLNKRIIFHLFPPSYNNKNVPGGHYLPHFDAFDSDQIPPDAWGRDNIWVGSR